MSKFCGSGAVYFFVGSIATASVDVEAAVVDVVSFGGALGVSAALSRVEGVNRTRFIRFMSLGGLEDPCLAESPCNEVNYVLWKNGKRNQRIWKRMNGNRKRNRKKKDAKRKG